MDASTVRASETSTRLAARFALVALPIPVERGFHYGVPEGLCSQVQVGSRVRVAFRRRRMIGTVVRLDQDAEVERVLEIEACLADESRIPESMLDLCRFVGERFGASLGETLEAVLPPALRRGRALQKIAHVRIACDGAVAKQQVLDLLDKHPEQSRALRLLLESRGQMRELDLVRLAKISSSPLKSLRRRGLVERVLVEALADPLLQGAIDSTPEPELTKEQRSAVDHLTRALSERRPEGFLLFGVTGSGKTEVYLQALRCCVDQGRQGIVLVPEISLTPQTVARFRSRFPRIAVLHSGLTEAQRLQQWRHIRDGNVDVVVGARSAVFAPVNNLGLLVVDEEHEPSFKQQNPPRYHAREVAGERSRRANAVLVLGSATPSLETFEATRSGRLQLLDLPHRVGGGSLPDALVVDLGYLPFTHGQGAHLITDRLRAAIERALSREEQIILFLNRRGFSRMIWCAQCRAPVRCTRCDTSLVMHRSANRMICHLCGHEILPVRACSACGAPSIRPLGFGTERIEDELRRTFPRARIARMDSDTTTERGAHERILGKFASGDVDILVGTQMIGKGLDFPRVTLVGIVSADTSLTVPDYRASERTFQLIAQVAGRAGRSTRGGQVIVQTLYPDHIAVRAAIQHDYRRFAEQELVARRAAGYPPFCELARVLLSHPEEARTRDTAREVTAQLLEVVRGESGFQVLGPAPCPVTRVRGRFRYQILIKSAGKEQLSRLLSGLRESLARRRPVRVTLDVDPSSML